MLLTHAHPDHAGALQDGWSGPVYATDETWAALPRYPIAERCVVAPRRPLALAGMTVEAFPLEHSPRAPAVGYRVRAGSAIFYAPDVVAIEARHEALAGIDLYVGDGAAVTRSIVRRRGGARIGHASIRAQLAWCAEEGVRRAIFHALRLGDRQGRSRPPGGAVAELGAAVEVEARIARDGLELTIR